jgi:hypothetical protein
MDVMRTLYSGVSSLKALHQDIPCSWSLQTAIHKKFGRCVCIVGLTCFAKPQSHNISDSHQFLERFPVFSAVETFCTFSFCLTLLYYHNFKC